MKIPVSIIKKSTNIEVSTDVDYEKLIIKIDISGIVDINTTDELSKLLNTIVKGGVKKILLNMERLKYIESTGIGMFINITKLIRAGKGDIAFMNVPAQIEEIFKLVNLQRFIKFFEKEEQAISYFRLFV